MFIEQFSYILNLALLIELFHVLNRFKLSHFLKRNILTRIDFEQSLFEWNELKRFKGQRQSING